MCSAVYEWGRINVCALGRTCLIQRDNLDSKVNGADTIVYASRTFFLLGRFSSHPTRYGCKWNFISIPGDCSIIFMATSRQCCGVVLRHDPSISGVVRWIYMDELQQGKYATSNHRRAVHKGATTWGCGENILRDLLVLKTNDMFYDLYSLIDMTPAMTWLIFSVLQGELN